MLEAVAMVTDVVELAVLLVASELRRTLLFCKFELDEHLFMRDLMSLLLDLEAAVVVVVVVVVAFGAVGLMVTAACLDSWL